MTDAVQHAERTVLGAVLLTPSEFDVLAPDLAPEDFEHQGHRAAWRVMTEIRETGAEVSFAPVLDRLERAGELGALGGVEGLGSLADSYAYVEARDLRAAVRLVRDSAQLRRLVETCTAITKAASGPIDSVGDFVDDAQERVSGVCLNASKAPYRSSKQVTVSAFRELSDRLKGKSKPGIDTGIKPIDDALGGMRPGQQIVIAARPSIGKSMFAGQVILNCAREGVPCIVFAAEMSAEEYTERLLANAKSVPLSIITGKRRAAEYDAGKLVSAAEELAQLPIVWEDSGTITPAGIRARVRRWKADRKLGAFEKPGIVVVDYLQILDLDDSRNREQAVAKASRTLKQLARDTKSVVLLLSQLNRALENRADSRPGLADLRESGAIEQDADVVIGLHRDRDKSTNRLEEWGLGRILKNRGGETGDVSLQFKGAYQRVQGAA